ncbi:MULTISPECIES: HEPN domain-containing protein [Thermodesulfovibrio]|jgi:HEPN domain-containing protein|uniref:HEPN domain-containing protein n=1 Tax=Thermodesulfovibrio TaxID=28261 RepID=UPI0026248613|nr:HEPN domain-containing protein [Thermodesulfovibrio sp.]
MKNLKEEIVLRWFKKAENDIKNIENNLKSEDFPTDTVCFHAQQAVEKFFKGALVYFQRDISKTHDLVRLLSEIVDLIPELKEFEEDLERLTEFSVEVRYPDTFYEPTLEEAKYSYEIATKIREIILNKVKI